MWPAVDDLLTETLAAEEALAEAYSEALFRWAPLAREFVLPRALTAAAGVELPPDPDGIASQQRRWEELVALLIVPAAVKMWDTAAKAAVDAVTTAGDVVGVAARALSAAPGARDQFMLSFQQNANGIPGRLRDRMRAVKAKHKGTMAELRTKLREFVTPGSGKLRDLAKEYSYQAASVLNHVAEYVATAVDAVVDKEWAAILDERTRDTHWTADGQRVPFSAPFTVGGVSMRYPHDPSAPARERINCRCRMLILHADDESPRRRAPKTETAARDARGVTRGGDNPEEPIAAAAAPSEEHTMNRTAEAARDAGATFADVAETVVDGETFRTFTDAVMAFVGTPTSDNRLLHTDIELSVRPLPLPLMWMKQSAEGHDNAYTVGVIEEARHEGDRILSSGYLLNTPEADEAADQLAHGVTRPSVDLAALQWMLTDEAGKEITEEEWYELPRDAKVFRTFMKAELIGTTLVSTPAFGATELHLNENREPRGAALVAAAAEKFSPRVYDHRLFEDPGLQEPTLPTLGDDGRVYGHLACWGACHRSIQQDCTFAPHSPSGYMHFHTSPAVRLDNGKRLPVGRLTVGTGHAPDSLGAAPAIAHYDHTGTCFALVRVGEDAHGIWFSGVVAPWATNEQIEEGLAAPLSGDWRNMGQGLDLIAALAVNTPGFVARGREDEQGTPIALVASLGPAPTSPRHGGQLTAEQIGGIVEAAVGKWYAKREADAELAGLLALADEKVGRPPTPAEEIDALLARRP